MFAYYISPSETNQHLWSFILFFFTMIAPKNMRFQGSVDWWEGLTLPSTKNLQSSSGLQEVLGGEKWWSIGKRMMSLMMIHGLKSTKDFLFFVHALFPKRVVPKHSHWTIVASFKKVYVASISLRMIPLASPLAVMLMALKSCRHRHLRLSRLHRKFHRRSLQIPSFPGWLANFKA